MIVPSKLFAEFHLCLERILLILLLNSVNSLHCLLILSPHANLLKFCCFFTFFLFVVKLLELFPQLIGFLLLIVPVPPLLTLIALKSANQVLIVIFSFLLFLPGDFLLIFLHLLDGRSYFLAVVGTSMEIILFLLTVELELELRMVDRVVYFFAPVCL